MVRVLALFSLALFAACGSGGAINPGSAALEGTVQSVDGNTGDRSNVPVTVMETGETFVTGTNGRFAFDSVPTGTVTLAVASDSMSIDSVEAGDVIEVTCSLENGRVREFSRSDDDEREAEVKVERNGLEAKVKIESDDSGEKFEAEIEGLAPGTSVDISLDDGSSVTPIATVVADSMGEAEVELETRNGDTLPGGAVSVEDLAGADVVFSSGSELARLTIPELPAAPANGGQTGDANRGRARLTALVAGVEGRVEIRQDSGGGDQRFQMEAERLAAGTTVRFEIEDKDNAGSFLALATVTAGTDGRAEINTQDGLAMPLGVSDVTDLVGLGVRVVSNGTVILTGTVPALGVDN